MIFESSSIDDFSDSSVGLLCHPWVIRRVTDRGGWKGKEPDCDRPQDFIITQARPAVYLRTDFVPVDVQKFSVREIDPLR